MIDAYIYFCYGFRAPQRSQVGHGENDDEEPSAKTKRNYCPYEQGPARNGAQCYAGSRNQYA